jgi:hypothetical protein
LYSIAQFPARNAVMLQHIITNHAQSSQQVATFMSIYRPVLRIVDYF